MYMRRVQARQKSCMGASSWYARARVCVCVCVYVCVRITHHEVSLSLDKQLTPYGLKSL